MTKCTHRITALVAAFTLTSITAHAATYDVEPARYRKDGGAWVNHATPLQAAITDAAGTDDILLVAPGTYDAISSLLNKRITIQSTGGAAVTIIDGKNANRCATLGGPESRVGENLNTVLIGFTLTRGYSTVQGGGVRHGTLHHCVIESNAAYTGGGAYQSTLNNCIIRNNISDNSGGGVYECTLNNCLVAGNRAAEVWTAGWGGGAFGSDLNNCTVVNNYAYTGGGVSSGKINNSIVWGNTCDPATLDPEKSYNYNYNPTFNYSCTLPAVSGGTGNTSSDPLFVNAAAGDYRLSATSPLRFSGSVALAAGITDLDGNRRVVNDQVSMGAYQYGSTPLTYTVVYNGNGSTGGSTASTSHTYGTAANLRANGFTRTGHTFAGWATSAGGAVVYANNASVLNLASTHNATVNLYARWTVHTYTVVYNGNGSTGGSTASTAHTYGTSASLRANGFTREGHVFAGWATSAGGAVVYADRASVINLTATQGATFNLYARWTFVPASLSSPGGVKVPLITTAYDGFVYDNNNTVRGTLTFNAKAAVKLDKKTGIASTNWTFSAKVVLQAATVSFSGKQEGAANAFTAETKGGAETLSVTLWEGRIYGTVSGAKVGGTLTVDGARSVFADKKDLAAQGRLDEVRGLYNVALVSGGGTLPMGFVSLSAGNLGAVKLAGALADGTKVSGSAKLLAGLNADGWYAVALHRPLYSKKGFIGGLLWLDTSTPSTSVRVDTGYDWFVDWVCEDPKKGGSFARALDVLGGYFGDGKNAPAVPQGLKFSVGKTALPPPVPGLTDARWIEEALPAGLDVKINGTKLSLDKGSAPKIPKGLTEYDYGIFNPSTATLSYTAKTGIFKGSFKVFYDGTDPKGKFQHKAISVSYTGIMVPDNGELIGLGTGTVTINKEKFGMSVSLEK